MNASTVADGGTARKRREQDDPERDADDTDRDLQERERDRERGDRPEPERRRQRRRDDERDLAGAEADRPRDHQTERSPCRGVREVDPWGVAKAECLQRTDLDEDVPKGPSHDADGQPDGTERRGEQERGADDREVVDDRRDRRRRESTLAVEHARRDRPEGQQDRAQDHDPRQLDRPGHRHRVEAGRVERDELVGEHEHERGEDQEQPEHQVGHGRHDPPGPLVTIAGDEAGDDRDQRRRHGTGRDELEQEIRDPERGEEGVELTWIGDGVDDDDEPQPAEHARDEEGARDDQPGAREGRCGRHVMAVT